MSSGSRTLAASLAPAQVSSIAAQSSQGWEGRKQPPQVTSSSCLLNLCSSNSLLLPSDLNAGSETSSSAKLRQGNNHEMLTSSKSPHCHPKLLQSLLAKVGLAWVSIYFLNTLLQIFLCTWLLLLLACKSFFFKPNYLCHGLSFNTAT